MIRGRKTKWAIPILAIISIEIFYIIILITGSSISNVFWEGTYMPTLLSFIPLALVLTIYFSWMKKWSFYGFNLQLKSESLVFFLPLILVIVILSNQDFSKESFLMTTFLIAYAILISFVLLGIFIGIVVTTLLPLGNIAAILASGILYSQDGWFLLLTGNNLTETSVHIVLCFLLGIVLAQVFVITRNLYPLFVFQSLFSLINTMSIESFNLWREGLVISFLAVTVIFLCFSIRKDESLVSRSFNESTL